MRTSAIPTNSFAREHNVPGHKLLGVLLTLLSSSCASSVARQPEVDPWRELQAQYQTIEAIRAAHPIPSSGRREQVEVLVERQRRLEPIYAPFISALRAYAQQTSDPRARTLYARERVLIGDEYATYLARYDRAIQIYRNALEMDPDNQTIRNRLAFAESRLFLSPRLFTEIQPGLTEAKVIDLIGYPRVDWVRETIRNGRVYSVWIYPKEDGGAAAVYFDDGVLYHKNWEAAPADSSGS